MFVFWVDTILYIYYRKYVFYAIFLMNLEVISDNFLCINFVFTNYKVFDAHQAQAWGPIECYYIYTIYSKSFSDCLSQYQNSTTAQHLISFV